MRIHLASGEHKRVEFSLAGRDLSYFDVRTQTWKAEPGTYRIEVGASSRDIRLQYKYVLAPGWQENRCDPASALTLDTPLPLVMERCGEQILGALGPLAQTPQVMMVWGYALAESLPLRDLDRFLPDIFTRAKLEELEALLAQA